MDSITQDMRFRLALLQYADKHGVTTAASRYKTNRQYIYRWRKRCDGTIESLRCRSKRPHHHPNQHTQEEISLIQRMRRRNPKDGLVVFWVKLRQKGYTRSITGLYRFLRRQGLQAEPKKNPKYIPKPYQQVLIPGEKVQIDVKVVPKSCITKDARDKDLKLYQYTAIDECTRWRYLAAYEEQSTDSSRDFLLKFIKRFPFPIRKVQTDNGTEFTKAFTGAKEGDLTLFELTLKEHGIEYQRIRPYTPRHNGKVERSHRKDNEYFYATHSFFSLEDFKKQLALYNRRYNLFPMRPLGWLSPLEKLNSFR